MCRSISKRELSPGGFVLKLRFWRKSDGREKTILSIQTQNLKEAKSFYVEAQSPDKALELMEKIRKEA